MSDDQIERLQREVLALAAVNRQLQADLEGRGLLAVAAPRDRLATPPPTGPPTSAGLGAFRSVITQVQGGTGDPDEPVRVVEAGGATYLLEGRSARPVPSSIIAAMLEELLGPKQTVTADQLANYADGDPLTVLQGPTGPPFLAMAGRRTAVRGWPTIQKVAAEIADDLDDGGELNVAAVVARTRAASATTPSNDGPDADPVDRLRHFARRAATRLGR